MLERERTELEIRQGEAGARHDVGAFQPNRWTLGPEDRRAELLLQLLQKRESFAEFHPADVYVHGEPLALVGTKLESPKLHVDGFGDRQREVFKASKQVE